MQRRIAFTAILIALTILSNDLFAQSTYSEVFSIFSTNCTNSNCHNNSDQAGGLDLEGIGANLAAQMDDVYDNLFQEDPQNSTAVSNHNKLIYPGDPYRSFVFRKVNNGLAPEVTLESGEGTDCPKNVPALDDKEIELIRQWILYAAPDTGQVMDHSLIDDYYDNGGINSLLQVPTPPPANEGFQIHLGPFFLPPSTPNQEPEEVEYFTKWYTHFPQDMEINKIETHMGSYSHHFILWKFRDPHQVHDEGLRFENSHLESDFVTGNQFSETLEMTSGTAFSWEQDAVLDLNSHFINYSTTKTTACEVYLNIYTQPDGTASQIMQSLIWPNYSIFIPNNNQVVTFDQVVSVPFIPLPWIYIWGLASHTHKYGVDFNIYERMQNGQKGPQIYDAGCPGGIPGCGNESFDYQHPPTLYQEPYLKIDPAVGVISEASFVNDGPQSVTWGETSNDEMMVTIAFFTLSEVGIDYGGGTPVIEINRHDESVLTFPNPTDDIAMVDVTLDPSENWLLEVYDISGKLILQDPTLEFIDQGNRGQIDCSDWMDGLYVFNLTSSSGKFYTGKFTVQH